MIRPALAGLIFFIFFVCGHFRGEFCPKKVHLFSFFVDKYIFL